MKLTKAQRVLLSEIAVEPRHVSDHYPPALKLVGGGLAEWHQGKWSETLRITPAGRAALAQEGE